MKEELYLKREAKKSGGDRYENTNGTLVIYFPQRISRSLHGPPVRKITIDIEVED